MGASSLPTPSALGRIDACTASEGLPHVRSSNAPARKGVVAHRFLASVPVLGRDEALAEADAEDRAALEAIDLSRIPTLDPKAYAAEVAYAYNPRTGAARELGRGLSREQARELARPEEIPGIADVVGLTADAAVVWDYKTGWGHVERAEANWQVRTYALMVARTHGRERAVGGIIRVLDNGSVWFDSFDLDAFDLDAHAAELRALLARRERILAGVEQPQLHEGPHCRYCPALHACPAKVRLLRAVVGDQDPLEQQLVHLNDERAARAWMQIKDARKLLDRLEDVVKDYIRQHPVRLSEDYVLEEYEEHKETIVPARAREALTRHYGDQVGSVLYSESVETKVTLTKAALERALRKHVLPTLPKGKITAVVKGATEALRFAGAMSVASYKRIDEHKVPRKAAALPAPAPEAKPEPPKAELEREARITACAADGGHRWGQMDDCLRCGVSKDAAVDVSTGHPARGGVFLCSCGRGAPACVDVKGARPPADVHHFAKSSPAPGDPREFRAALAQGADNLPF